MYINVYFLLQWIMKKNTIKKCLKKKLKFALSYSENFMEVKKEEDESMKVFFRKKKMIFLQIIAYIHATFLRTILYQMLCFFYLLIKQVIVTFINVLHTSQRINNN